jgi:hypothetical protein
VRALFGPGLLLTIAVLFCMIAVLELIFGGGVRWLPAIIYAVILAPVLLTVAVEAKRSRS